MLSLLRSLLLFFLSWCFCCFCWWPLKTIVSNNVSFLVVVIYSVQDKRAHNQVIPTLRKMRILNIYCHNNLWRPVAENLENRCVHVVLSSLLNSTITFEQCFVLSKHYENHLRWTFISNNIRFKVKYFGLFKLLSETFYNFGNWLYIFNIFVTGNADRQTHIYADN